ncbi:serine/threonine-protein kinase, partial [Zavarzinella formosa]|uniref:serine/threonine-protein kinase n=1 Tax=Zavarzinella formosa TaxID=360055 RepID=UPI0012F82010
MTDDREQQSQLILAYLDGSLSPEQMSEAEKIIEADPDVRTIPAETDKLETFINRLQKAIAMPPFPAERDDQANERIQQRVAEEIQLSAKSDKTIYADIENPLISMAFKNIPAADGHRPDLGSSFGFLSPPQAEGELGRLNGYRVLRKLGEGGMGIVFEAEDIRLKRLVALKVMKPKIAAEEHYRERFLREAQAAAAVVHDHICPIYQIGEESGVLFIAMPFLKGEALDAYLKRLKRLKRQRPLPIPIALRIGREIAEGLAAANDAGLVHRDIKPGNIWLESDPGNAARKIAGQRLVPDRVKILDFGLARFTAEDVCLTQSGAILGTPAYMAPEQARGKQVDHRADLFSLGVMLYEMTTGRLPFTGKDALSILTSLALDEPTAPVLFNMDVPPELSDLIMQLLSKSPDQRPANGWVIAESLLTILTETVRLGVEADPPMVGSPTPSSDESTKTNPWQSINKSASPPIPGKTRKKVASKPKRKSSGGKTWIALALGLLLLVGGGGAAAYKLFFETKNGTLVVEVDGDANVRFKNGELLIFDSVGNQKYILKPGQRTETMPPGQYRVQVASADGVKLETPEFTMTKRGAKIKVTVDPMSVAKKEHEATNPDREAAEWALSTGGTVEIKIGDQRLVIKDRSKLPEENFQVTNLLLNKNKNVTDEGLRHVRDLKKIWGLHFSQTAISDAGLEHLRDLPELSMLTYDDMSMTGKGIAPIGTLRMLSVLSINNAAIIDADLIHLKNCTHLMA